MRVDFHCFYESRFDQLNEKPAVDPGQNEIMTRSKAMHISTMGVHLNDLSESIFKNVNDDDLLRSRRVPTSNMMSKSLMGKLDEVKEGSGDDLMTKSLFVPKSSSHDAEDAPGGKLKGLQVRI